MQELQFAEEQYKRSFFGLLLAPPISAAIGAALGFAYAFVVNINPFIYLGFIAAIVLGVLLAFGGIIATGIFGSSDRFTRLLAAIAAAAGCLWMYYAQWLSMNEVPLWSITPIMDWYTLGFVEPFRVAFEEIAPYVSYSVSRAGRSSGGDVGGALWFWYIEIALIAGPPLLFALFAGGTMVNTATGGSMNDIDQSFVVSHLAKSDIAAKEADMKARDFSLFQLMSGADANRILSNAGAKKKEHVPASSIAFFRDTKDASVYSIEVSSGGYTYDNEDGWESSFDDVVVKHLLISQAEYEGIVARLSQ
ncbi:hypothetical protein [Yoonia sp. BS5-3]|uniref:Uncharacterized protein n=1 Tax=Yoonia phaeophyticola TaxID=3137369 RepID=A0ABZ2V629_9RHOB